VSTDLVVLSATDVPSVRGTAKAVEALRIIGSPTQRWHFVLNRADARTGISVRDISTTVGLDIDVAIPESRLVPVSLNQGAPVIESEPRSPVSLEMSHLVDRVLPSVAGHPGSNAGANGNGGFLRRKRGMS